MTVKLTEALANNIKSKEKEYDIRDNEIAGFLIRVQKSGNASYVLAYRNSKGQSRRYKIGKVGEITAAKARQLARELKFEIASRKDPNEEKRIEKKNLEKRKQSTLSSFYKNRYLKYIEANHRDDSGTKERLKKFVQLWGETPLAELSTQRLNDYSEERLGNGIAESTINRELNCLRGLFRLAEEEDVIQSNPFKRLKSLKIDKKPITRYLSTHEENHLISVLIERQQNLNLKRLNANKFREERSYESFPDFSKFKYSNYLLPMVLIAIKTGLRRSELLSLKWSNITIGENNKQIYVLGANTKNSQSRSIPLNKEACTILEEWKSFCMYSPIKTDLVFPNPITGKQMKEVGSAWNRVLKEAKIPNFRFHDLRHTFASKLAIKGVDLNTIRELMGHSDIKMTLRYANLSPEHLSSAVEGI